MRQMHIKTTISHLLGWLLSKKLTSVGKDLCALLVGMQNGTATGENSMAVSQKIKITMCTSDLLCCIPVVYLDCVLTQHC